jgi:hypothetical protein
LERDLERDFDLERADREEDLDLERLCPSPPLLERERELEDTARRGGVLEREEDEDLFTGERDLEE